MQLIIQGRIIPCALITSVTFDISAPLSKNAVSAFQTSCKLLSFTLKDSSRNQQTIKCFSIIKASIQHIKHMYNHLPQYCFLLLSHPDFVVRPIIQDSPATYCAGITNPKIFSDIRNGSRNVISETLTREIRYISYFNIQTYNTASLFSAILNTFRICLSDPKGFSDML